MPSYIPGSVSIEQIRDEQVEDWYANGKHHSKYRLSNTPNTTCSGRSQPPRAICSDESLACMLASWGNKEGAVGAVSTQKQLRTHLPDGV